MNLEAVRAAIADVLDPELPVLTIAELGILRAVAAEGEHVVVTITPTYSGCPAMDAIGADIRAAAAGVGAQDVEVRTVLSPAWTTDWIDDAARAKLADYGIAPPGPATGAIPLTLSVRCPQCGSPDTREVSRFSGTGCKALWACTACREPFEHLKAI
ncbi:MAG TPA: 1,2-phenylacetyl-CoA epoxidase subunit PaaD [Sporichthyaceae bacterium]|nr:1,2-phenylacetyl-CoA epoxidase subunit PaaD [Sporichthyaceae bacterium]